MHDLSQTCMINLFSFTFFFSLIFSEAFISWPTLFLEVLSVDQWERFRTEGYGYVTLPNKAGTHDITVNTWRPTGNGLVPKMRRFFIGGSPELEDVTYVKQPAGSDDVRVYCNILFYHYPFASTIYPSGQNYVAYTLNQRLKSLLSRWIHVQYAQRYFLEVETT